MSDPVTTAAEQENRRLRAQLSQLLQQANQNQQIWQRHQAFDLQLIAASGLRELLDQLFHKLATTISLEVVTLTLLDPDYEARRVMCELDLRQSDYPQLLFQHAPAELGPLYERAGVPLLARYSEEAHGAFFPDPIPAPASVALMPLCRNGRTIGSLNFGSADATRFADGLRADFLAHMASIVAVCLENVINKERLQRMGLTDALTGVHNRRYLEDRLLEEIERARRHGNALSCLYVDIDHFKQINDRVGHQAGDQVLRDVAACIKAELRLSDTLARFGGEEFVVLLADTACDDARNVAERIRQSVAEQPLIIEGHEPLAVSISIGVSSTLVSDSHAAPAGVLPVTAVSTGSASGELARQLLGDADRALYRAKEGGRNRVEVDAGN